tara:strand:+ start:83 stop:262 length:180 start_codon:yes stop_codon:yes gene_type:complete
MLSISEFNTNLFSKLKDKVTLKKCTKYSQKNIGAWKLQNIQNFILNRGLQEAFKDSLGR